MSLRTHLQAFSLFIATQFLNTRGGRIAPPPLLIKGLLPLLITYPADAPAVPFAFADILLSSNVTLYVACGRKLAATLPAAETPVIVIGFALLA